MHKRSTINIIVFLISILLLLGMCSAQAQTVTIPREAAEYYYKQKKENDVRKKIIATQLQTIDVLDSLVANYKTIEGLWKRDKERFLQLDKNQEEIIKVQQKENKRLKKKLRWAKVKIYTVAIIAAGVVIISN